MVLECDGADLQELVVLAYSGSSALGTMKNNEGSNNWRGFVDEDAMLLISEVLVGVL